MELISEAVIAGASKYNEAEIRFHILDPIMRLLGYSDGDNVYLILEEKLEYPYLHVGRRSKKDLPLGFADYRAGVKGARGSFVVEAKAGGVPITAREVEQAHSYAAHAQVGANYFVLCNGSYIAVYETLSGPRADPVVELPIPEVNTRFHELGNILAPVNLVRNCRVLHDTKLSLAPGLGSSVRIRSGNYAHCDHDIRYVMDGQDVTASVRQTHPQLADLDSKLDFLKSNFEFRVSEGQVLREDDGRIVAHIEFCGATIHHQQAMAIMGINKASFAAADKFLSTDAESPTICESQTEITVSNGTMMPQFFGGAVPANGNLHGNMLIKLAMHFADGRLRGQYVVVSDQWIDTLGALSMTVEMDIAGTFELVLDI